MIPASQSVPFPLIAVSNAALSASNLYCGTAQTVGHSFTPAERAAAIESKSWLQPDVVKNLMPSNVVPGMLAEKVFLMCLNSASY